MAAYLELRHISYSYPFTPEGSRPALSDIDLELLPGEALCITGPNGSGKSTIAQLMAGLLKPTLGETYVDGMKPSRRSREEFRKRVGLLFQSPEDQLFADTVEKDIAYGPRNQGLNKEIVRERVKEASRLVGIDLAVVGNRSPFSLSEGEKRRVALAGILALKPDILILDEPTVGQDHENKERTLDCLRKYREQREATMVIVSHDLDDAVRITERFVILSEGRIRFSGDISDLVITERLLEEVGVGLPPGALLARKLVNAGLRVEAPIDAAYLCRKILEGVEHPEC